MMTRISTLALLTVSFISQAAAQEWKPWKEVHPELQDIALPRYTIHFHPSAWLRVGGPGATQNTDYWLQEVRTGRSWGSRMTEKTELFQARTKDAERGKRIEIQQRRAMLDENDPYEDVVLDVAKKYELQPDKICLQYSFTAADPFVNNNPVGSFWRIIPAAFPDQAMLTYRITGEKNPTEFDTPKDETLSLSSLSPKTPGYVSMLSVKSPAGTVTLCFSPSPRLRIQPDRLEIEYVSPNLFPRKHNLYIVPQGTKADYSMDIEFE